MGAEVGALEGTEEGSGTGLPGVNVGARVGLTVGALLGEAEGCGVGLY